MINRMTWEELINSNIETINIIGYGSLLNINTHHNNHGELIPVIVKDYQRLYNVSYTPEMCETRAKIFEKYAEFQNEDFSKEKNKLIYETNSGALNVRYKQGCELNGLMFEIPKKDFVSYAEREKFYFLDKVEYISINPENGKINKEKQKKEAYIMVAMDSEINEQNPYYLYDKGCREGAYKLGLFFGLMYDKTTFFKNELSYENIIERYYSVGQEVEIINHNISEAKFNFPIKNLVGKKGKIIKLNKTEVEIEINNEIYLLDINDIS